MFPILENCLEILQIYRISTRFKETDSMDTLKKAYFHSI